MIEEVENEPYIPIHWGANKKGMQAGDELPPSVRQEAVGLWLRARDNAVRTARYFLDLEVEPHKQNPNRLLEPFAHISVLVTSTQWENWFGLRNHPAAEPHIRTLAREMHGAMANSTPTELPDDGWHLPYIDRNSDDLQHAAISILEREHRELSEEELMNEILFTLAKVSVARCARVSYNNHDGTPPRLEKDLQLFDDLIMHNPMHASPAEHQAQPDRYIGCTWEKPHEHGNFVGWRQFRKRFAHECPADRPYTGPRIIEA